MPSPSLSWLWRLAIAMAYLLPILLVSFIWGPQKPIPRKILGEADFFHFLNFAFREAGLAISLVVAVLVRLASCTLFANLYSRRRAASEIVIWSLLVAYWAASIWFFDWLAQSTGSCLLIEAASKRECLAAGGTWAGFDISGHAFLVGLAVGIFADQLKFAQETFKNRQLNSSGDCEAGSSLRLRLKSSLPRWSFYILSILLMASVWLAWTLLLLHTCYHFHTPAEKLVGLLLAFAFWAGCPQIRHGFLQNI